MIGMLCALLGLLHQSWVFWVLIGGGFFWQYKNKEPLEWKKYFENLNWIEILVLTSFGVLFIVRFLGAIEPQAHGDPILYHLVGPRLWVEAGKLTLIPNLPNAILASYWEYLYIWPQVFFYKGIPGSGLIEAQILSQWTHLFWGTGTVFSLLFYFLSPYAEKRLHLWIALFAALCVGSVQWSANLAKNDWGIMSFVLSGMLCIVTLKSKKYKFLQRALSILTGIFWGLAIMGKPNAVFAIGAAITLFILFGERKYFILIFFGIIIGVMPNLLRNWALTKNPFFPMLNSIFPSPWMSLSWQDHLKSYQPQKGMVKGFLFWLERFTQLAQESLGTGHFLNANTSFSKRSA